MKKTKVGFIEHVKICGPKECRTVHARIDTGAARNSIDEELAKKLGIKTIIEHKVIKSAQGVARRPIVRASLQIAGRKIKSTFSLADRKHMKYDVLIGRKTLKKGFIIDPDKI